MSNLHQQCQTMSNVPLVNNVQHGQTFFKQCQTMSKSFTNKQYPSWTHALSRIPKVLPVRKQGIHSSLGQLWTWKRGRD